MFLAIKRSATVAAALGLALGSACDRAVPLGGVGPSSPTAFVRDVSALAPVVLHDEADTARYLEAFPLAAYRLRPSEGVGQFYIDTSADVIKAVLDAGEAWEPEIRDLLAQHVRQGTSALDVGAHIGTHTITLARGVGSQGHVFAFEPQKKLFRELQMNVRANQIGNVTPLRFALGDGDPRVVEMEPDIGGNEGGNAVGPGGDRVELRTVDSFGFTNVSLIKIDAEGYEDHVLDGAARTIATQRPVLIVEIMGGTDYATATAEQRAGIDRTKARMRQWGYTVTQVSGHDYLGLPVRGAASAPGGSRNGSIGIASYSTSRISRCSVFWGVQHDPVPGARLHERLGQRRPPADVAAVHVHFVQAHDGDDVLEVGGIAVGDGGAEKNARGCGRLARRGRVHDLRGINTFGEKPDARVDLAQSAFGVHIVGVFAAIAVGGGPRHHLGHRRPFPVEQEPVLVLEALQSCRRDVVLDRPSGCLTHGFAQRPLGPHRQAHQAILAGPVSITTCEFP